MLRPLPIEGAAPGRWTAVCRWAMGRGLPTAAVAGLLLLLTLTAGSPTRAAESSAAVISSGPPVAASSGVASSDAVSVPVPASLTVVMTDNYPPLSFRDEKGDLRGLRKDMWDLWSRKTGVPVTLIGMQWAAAQQAFQQGKIDIIDTIFETPGRDALYDFSPPYATTDVVLFFDSGIAGITDPASLRGLTVGVKEGAICGDLLANAQVTAIRRFPSYETMVDAAARRDIRVFCAEKQPGLFFLLKHDQASRFRYTNPLYTGEFRWAVKKGNTALRAFVANGFAQVSDDERQTVESRWIGTSLTWQSSPAARRLIVWIVIIVVASVFGLTLWNRSLRRQVEAKTFGLTQALEVLQVTQQHFMDLVTSTPVGVFETNALGHYTYVNDPWARITGQSAQEGLGDAWSASIHPDDREAVLAAWETALATETVFQKEYRVVRPAGGQPVGSGDAGARETLWVFAQAVPRESKLGVAALRRGHRPGYIGSLTDITARKMAEQALVDSERRFRSIIDNVNDAILVQDIETASVLFANQRLNELLGLDPQERPDGLIPAIASGISLFEVGEIEPWIDRAIQGTPQTFDWTLRTADGGLVWVEVSLRRAHLGTFGDCLLIVARDITERRLSEAVIRERQEHLRLSTHLVNMVVFKQDCDLRYTWMIGSPVVLKLDQVVGRTDYELLASGDEHPLIAIKRHAITRGETTRQEIGVMVDGVMRYIDLAIEPIKDAAGEVTGILGASLDITEKKAAQARMEFLAHHDSLTGLPNRWLAHDRMELSLSYALRRGLQNALIYADLDHFKTINDSLGHMVGDGVLREIADRLRACVRETDTISRQGGDEFVIMLADVQSTEAIVGVAAKIIDALNRPLFIEGQELVVTISMGIAVYPDDSADLATLMKKADTALYYAKNAGRNTYRFFTEQMNIDTLQHLTVRNGLRQALKNNEFVLYYQPQISLDTNRVVGVEALIRWQHPERGMVPPAAFIELAESSGLIVPIGEWVLREACRQAVAWTTEGLPPLGMSVNLSAMQFRREGLEETIVSALRDSGLDPGRLDLELTESLLIHDTDVTLSTVRRLSALGVRVSIDDFGTGYSSLSYLKRFSVDCLKIDQSFVRDLPNDVESAAIVHAVIQMAHSLNLRVVAEGVETVEAERFLADQGCDVVQGYYYSRPLPADEFVHFLRAQEASLTYAYGDAPL